MTATREQRSHTVAKGRQSGFIVVLEDIHDPHNAAAIERTADAFGIQNVWLVLQNEPSWNPRRIGKSSSSSANKWLSFRTFKSTAECIAALGAEKYVSVAAVVDGEIELGAARFAEHKRIALWIGNEHRGLSAAARSAAALSVRIPMRGMVESLNVSVAAAICLYEITRQRDRAGGFHLGERQAVALAEEWMKR